MAAARGETWGGAAVEPAGIWTIIPLGGIIVQMVRPTEPTTTALHGYQRSPYAADLQNRLARIEGQVRGVRGMLEDGRYCIDVLTQIDAAAAALARVQDRILAAHLNHCVADALAGDDVAARREKVDEVVDLLKRFRRSG